LGAPNGDSERSFCSVSLRGYCAQIILFWEADRPSGPGGSWTLHQLRHFALIHTAGAGANTATLLAYSGHTSVALPGPLRPRLPEAFARWQAHRN
jgi:integrase/recombinase XerC/integrase/recombinase XerD